jgi:hypothetical protein
MPTSESNITPVTSTVKDGKSKSSTMYNETNHTSFSWLGLQSCLPSAAGARSVVNETRSLFTVPNESVLKPAIHLLHAF